MDGTWFIAPTPFAADASLDIESQGRLVEHVIAWGVDGITAMGMMAEPGSLTDDERDRALKAIFQAANRRVPIAVGCSAGSLSVVLERVRYAERFGGDGGTATHAGERRSPS